MTDPNITLKWLSRPCRDRIPGSISRCDRDILRDIVVRNDRGKQFHQLLLSELKYLFHFLLNKNRIQRSAQRIKPKCIADDICHLNSIICFFEVMLVMPEFVRTKPLLIDKIKRLFNVSDFCYPRVWYSKHRMNFVSDYHSGIHFIRKLAGDFKVEPLRSYYRKVIRIGEKLPRFSYSNG